MKLKKSGSRGTYETPAILEVNVISEGILCESGLGGSTAERYDRVEDVDGWGI